MLIVEPARLFGTIIMRTSYGFDDIGRNESLIKSAEHVVEEVGEAIKPTKFLVNVLPALQYVPAWFPGAGWKRHLLWVAAVSENTRRQPFEDAKTTTVSSPLMPPFFRTSCIVYLTSLTEQKLFQHRRLPHRQSARRERVSTQTRRRRSTGPRCSRDGLSRYALTHMPTTRTR